MDRADADDRHRVRRARDRRTAVRRARSVPDELPHCASGWRRLHARRRSRRRAARRSPRGAALRRGRNGARRLRPPRRATDACVVRPRRPLRAERRTAPAARPAGSAARHGRLLGTGAARLS